MEVNLAQWREIGEWWASESPREIRHYRDQKGIRRETITDLPSPSYDKANRPYEDHSQDADSYRPRKTRDEKVAKAVGEFTSTNVTVLTKASALPYAPLHLISGYSFGRSVLLANELPNRLAAHGLPAAAITDHFSLAGAYEFALGCKKAGIKPLIGASLEMEEGGEITLIALNPHGYRSLSRLITECHLDEYRLYPLCTLDRLRRHKEGLICLTGGDVGRLDRLLIARQYELAESWIDTLIGIYGNENVYIEHERSFLPWTLQVGEALRQIAQKKALKEVAGGIVTHAERADFPSQDVILCSETLCTVEEIIGRKPQRHPNQPPVGARPVRSLNAERFLRNPAQFSRLYVDRPELLTNTLLLAERIEPWVLPKRVSLPSLYENPNEVLWNAIRTGMSQRHKTITRGLFSRVRSEFEVISRLGFANHFVAAWDFCEWAKSRGILFSGRGSVVDSAVAYCLGLCRIDAYEHQLHFDRFLPKDGTKRPDIDIDFEAKRRDDVRQYLIDHYGKEHVAAVCAFGAYNTRGIIREAGKALGIPSEALGFLAKRIHGGVSPDDLEEALQRKPELRASNIPKERYRWLFRLAKTMADVPQNIRVHSSGVVLSSEPIRDIVPLVWSASEQDTENLRIMQWDKRSAKHCFDKFDILCLRGQDVLSGTQLRVAETRKGFNVEQISLTDPEIFRTVRAGELIGIPQSASPAMRQAHMRLGTKDLKDTSLIQAGIRPGVGGAVKINELIARRRGKPYSFEHRDLEAILGHTYGIIVFQEQVDQLLQTICGYTSGEAEDIRDAIHKQRREDYGQTIKDVMISRAKERGYSDKVALQAFEMVSGFKGYGFAQGHALAFAEISLRSVYCQQNFPAPYFASLLDAQPAGYYGPHTLLNEARIRGVKVLPPDINISEEFFAVEDVQCKDEPQLLIPDGGIRIALKQIGGLSAQSRQSIVSERCAGYTSFYDFCVKVQPAQDEVEQLILCGAFDRICSNRRALMWAATPTLRAARAQVGSLGLEFDGPCIDLTVPDYSEAEKAVHERTVLDADVDEHLMAFERERVKNKGGLTTLEVKKLKPGDKAMVVGNPIRLRFPPTASGKRVVFFDLEDETGLLNVTAFDETYQKYGHAFVCHPYVALIGQVQDRDGVPAYLAEQAYAYHPNLLSHLPKNTPLPLVVSDFLVG